MATLYSILNVKEDADFTAIRSNYLKLCLKYHPDKSNEEDCNEKFCKISAAFEIIGNDQNRMKYDNELKQQRLIATSNNNNNNSNNSNYNEKDEDDFYFRENIWNSIYKYQNIHDIHYCLNMFFTLFSGFPHGDVNNGIAVDQSGNSNFSFNFVPSSYSGFGYEVALPGMLFRDEAELVNVKSKNIPCTLEELYNGCEKKFKLGTPSGNVTSVTIKIERGWMNGTRIKLSNPRALFIIEEIIPCVNYPRFTRVNDDLYYYVPPITLTQALSDCVVEFIHLDDRKVNIKVKEIISPGMKKCVKREGMPYIGRFLMKGDLYLVFESIIFPTEISEFAKNVIRTSNFTYRD